MRRSAQSAGAVLLLALFGASTPAHAQAPRGLPPGLEPEVARLVFAGDEPPLGESVRVLGASIRPDRVEIEIGSDQESGLVWLAHPEADLRAERIGTTPSFSVWLPESTPRELRPHARRLVERIARRDDDTFWPRAEVAPDATVEGRTWSPTHPRRALRQALRALAWGALLSLLGCIAWLRRRDLRGEWLWLVGLFATALALRLSLPPWAPLHANEHGIEELRLLGGWADLRAAYSPYGMAYPELVRGLSDPFGGGARTALALGATFGALSVPLLYHLAHRLFESRPGALFAALALAAHPTHVRLSLSESPRPLAGTLWLLGITLALFAFGSGAGSARSTRMRAFALVGAGAALGLASELRVLTMLLPVAAVAWLLFTPRRRPSGWIGAAIGGLFVLSFAALHGELLLSAVVEGSERVSLSEAAALSLSSTKNVLSDPTLSSALLVPGVVAGAVIAAATGRARSTAGLLLVSAALMVPAHLVTACRTDLIRYQVEAHFGLLLLLAAWGRVPGSTRARAGTLALAASTLLAGTIPGLADIARPDVHAQAYRVAREQAPRPPGRLVLPPRQMTHEPRIRSDFAEAWASGLMRGEPSRRGETCHVWIGVPCWSFHEAETEWELVDGIPFRRECAELVGGVGRLENLTTVTVPHRAQEFHTIGADRIAVGYAPCAP